MEKTFPCRTVFVHANRVLTVVFGGMLIVCWFPLMLQLSPHIIAPAFPYRLSLWASVTFVFTWIASAHLMAQVRRVRYRLSPTRVERLVADRSAALQLCEIDTIAYRRFPPGMGATLRSGERALPIPFTLRDLHGFVGELEGYLNACGKDSLTRKAAFVRFKRDALVADEIEYRVPRDAAIVLVPAPLLVLAGYFIASYIWLLPPACSVIWAILTLLCGVVILPVWWGLWLPWLYLSRDPQGALARVHGRIGAVVVSTIVLVYLVGGIAFRLFCSPV